MKHKLFTCRLHPSHTPVLFQLIILAISSYAYLHISNALLLPFKSYLLTGLVDKDLDL